MTMELESPPEVPGHGDLLAMYRFMTDPDATKTFLDEFHRIAKKNQDVLKTIGGAKRAKAAIARAEEAEAALAEREAALEAKTQALADEAEGTRAALRAERETMLRGVDESKVEAAAAVEAAKAEAAQIMKKAQAMRQRAQEILDNAETEAARRAA